MGKVIQVLDTETGKVSYMDLSEWKKTPDISNKCLIDIVKRIVAETIEDPGGELDLMPIAIFSVFTPFGKGISETPIRGRLLYPEFENTNVILVNNTDLVFKQGTYEVKGTLRALSEMMGSQITNIAIGLFDGLNLQQVSVDPPLPITPSNPASLFTLRLIVTSPNDGGRLRLTALLNLLNNTVSGFILGILYVYKL